MSLCSFSLIPPKPHNPPPGPSLSLKITCKLLAGAKGPFCQRRHKASRLLYSYMLEKRAYVENRGPVKAVSVVPWSSLLHQMCWMHCCLSRIGSISRVLALNISLSLSCLGRNRNLVRLHCLKPLLFESCHIRNGEFLHAETLSVNRCETAKLEVRPIDLSWIRYN